MQLHLERTRNTCVCVCVCDAIDKVPVPFVRHVAGKHDLCE